MCVKVAIFSLNVNSCKFTNSPERGLGVDYIMNPAESASFSLYDISRVTSY